MTTLADLQDQRVVLVSGSRSVRNYFTVATWLAAELCAEPTPFVLLQGGAVFGVDRIARLWAIRNRVRCYSCPADWDRLGKKAGMIRNNDMLAVSNRLLAIWDGSSKGTAQAIQRGQRLGLQVTVLVLNPKTDYQDRNVKNLQRYRRLGDRSLCEIAK